MTTPFGEKYILQEETRRMVADYDHMENFLAQHEPFTPVNMAISTWHQF